MGGERLHMSLYCMHLVSFQNNVHKDVRATNRNVFISQLHPKNIPCALISCQDPAFQLSMDYITSTLAKVWCTVFMPTDGILM